MNLWLQIVGRTASRLRLRGNLHRPTKMFAGRSPPALRRRATRLVNARPEAFVAGISVIVLTQALLEG
jgi:hypothetical protein